MKACARCAELELEVERLRAIVDFGRSHSFAQAERVTRISDDEKLRASEIATRFGIRKEYVNKLLKARRELHPDIVAAWKAKHPVATTERLYRLATQHDPEGQLAAWAKESTRRRNRAAT